MVGETRFGQRVSKMAGVVTQSASPWRLIIRWGHSRLSHGMEPLKTARFFPKKW